MPIQYSFELTGDYHTKLAELADGDNCIKINPITCNKAEFTSYLMYLMSENAKQISALVTTVESLSERVTTSEKKVLDLEEAMTAKDEECNTLREDLSAANLTIENLRRDVDHLQKRADQVDQACLEQERHSRSSNVRIGGIEESPQEDCLQKVKEVFNKYGLNDVDIENTHRVGAKQEGVTRYMIVKLVRRTERRVVLKKRKDFFEGNNPLYEDLPKQDVAVKKKYKLQIEAHYKKKDKVYFTRGAWYVNDVRKYF